MSIVRYRPFSQGEISNAFDRLSSLQQEFDRVFNTSFDPLSGSSFSRWNPALDVYQDKEKLTVVAELPGMKKEEIEISLHGRRLYQLMAEYWPHVPEDAPPIQREFGRLWTNKPKVVFSRTLTEVHWNSTLVSAR